MNQAKILVVEDEPVVGHDLRSRLEAMGHTVTAVVVSGEEALLEAEKGRPDLVLLDIAIKGTLTGPEAAEAIRTRLGIPVVFVAGHADPERLDRVRPTTPLGCLLEPFTDREIEMAVDMARYVSWIVSDRQRAEEALQESERRYRLLVETAAEGIAVAQGDRLVFVNDMAEHISGWTKDALLSRPFLEFVHPEDRDGVARRHLARLKGETLPRRNRYRLLRPDGSTTWVEANGVLIDWEGQPASLNLFTDITDRVSDEQALRESQSRYHQLFANMKSGVVIFAAQDNGDRFVITDVNQAGERIGNFDKDEVIGRSVPEVFPGIETWGLLEVFRRVWRTGAPERLPVSRYMDDRLDLWVENYIYRLPSGELVAVYDDVTERARAEAALRASRREWEQIFEAIGHPTLILDPEHGLVNANRAAL
ncbi:MAG: PAS domain S-box protein, partial [Proteobacteria bacterium]|nr:PAS domain S-box protein [Pseudomonadota bacterium]MBU1740956.1 PAS domain S-box protein [Pseudomonadota bacterium]